MKTRNYAFACVAAAASILAAASAANAYSAKVRKACAGDYQNFCSQYAPGSNELRRCFESNRKGLTHRCISALIDAGEVPAKYLRRRR
jgi:hypothetical protein